MSHFKLLIFGIQEVVQIVDDDQTVLTGEKMNIVAKLRAKDAKDGYSIVVDCNGIIVCIVKDYQVFTKFPNATFEKKLDAHGKCVIPGLIDGHTHAIWVGDRVHEFSMKLAGASYMEVHKEGGGINYTVNCVQKATFENLYESFKERAKEFIKAGTTLMECKSGYGLHSTSEIKMLNVIETARKDKEIKVEICSTYCGAHSIPKSSTAEEYTEDILNIQLPEIQSLISAGKLHVDNIDVFCEKGVFSVQQCRKILLAGKNIGLKMNFHGEELSLLHSAEMGADIGASAISHLEEVSIEGIKAMSNAGTIGVILPTTAYILRLKRPDVRLMINEGMAVALGSDFNPNAFCFAMPIVMHLACVLLHMTMEEALIASTLNAAASLGKSKTHGSLQAGKVADMLILNSPRWEHLIYQFGNYQNVIDYVIKNGAVVHKRED